MWSEKWPLFEYKPQKKSGMASWESSYNRFMAGDTLQAIAMNPTNGRTLVVTTVFNHVLQGLEMGKEVDLKRLMKEYPNPLPTASTWREIQQSITLSGIDPLTTTKITKKELLLNVANVNVTEALEQEFKARTEEQTSLCKHWFAWLDLVITFTRTNIHVKCNDNDNGDGGEGGEGGEGGGFVKKRERGEGEAAEEEEEGLGFGFGDGAKKMKVEQNKQRYEYV